MNKKIEVLMKTSNMNVYLFIEFYNAAGTAITVWQSGRPPCSSEKKLSL
ncbi:hypothetical protein [Candidatus Nitrotoga arctica]|nr:hypothetical protein [Candidatus Nitrotoga arctica]